MPSPARSDTPRSTRSVEHFAGHARRLRGSSVARRGRPSAARHVLMRLPPNEATTVIPAGPATTSRVKSGERSTWMGRSPATPMWSRPARVSPDTSIHAATRAGTTAREHQRAQRCSANCNLCRSAILTLGESRSRTDERVPSTELQLYGGRGQELPRCHRLQRPTTTSLPALSSTGDCRLAT